MNKPYYQNGTLYLEDHSLSEIAKQFGTPCYVYSRKILEAKWRSFDEACTAIPHQICYAVKACSNIALLSLLARLGSGFDIVSQGELERVLAAGGLPQKIVFSGVGKQRHELIRALDVGVGSFNIESKAELLLLNELAGLHHTRAPISLRINPDISVPTHPYIATGTQSHKFGIPCDEALNLYELARDLPHLSIQGMGCHIGSQITKLTPFLSACDVLLSLISELKKRGIHIQHINLGGGLGVPYRDEETISIESYATALSERVKQEDPSLKLLLEPGRAIIAHAGLLLTQVLYLKSNGKTQFAIVDAAMNDLLRPALYEAWHEIVPVQAPQAPACQTYQIVGPVCETADYLGLNRTLSLNTGDLLAVLQAGAYGFSMSSNYNSRPRPPEVLVDGQKVHLIRPAETIHSLFANECLIA